MRDRRDFSDHYFIAVWYVRQAPAPAARKTAVLRAWDTTVAMTHLKRYILKDTPHTFGRMIFHWGKTEPILNAEGYPVNSPAKLEDAA